MDISEQDYQKAVAVVMDCSSGSVSNLQRKLYWGYARAAAAIDRMQEEFIVSPMYPSGRRDVYPSDIHQLWKDHNAVKLVPESNAILSALLDAIKKLGSGDFVLVPKLLSDQLADELASDAFNNIQSMFDYEHRGSTVIEREQFRLKWCRNKAKEYQHHYKTLIEAQEQGHD